jgi:predicted ATPase
MPVAVPSGTVTFLFTDIEGSTRRWEADPVEMRALLEGHDKVLREAIEARGGWLFKHTGDGVCAAFPSATPAVEAAIAAQRLLALPVRMGLATGEAEQRGDDYFGPALNRASRVMAAGHGGQILVAASTSGLVEGFDLVDLGERRLRDLSEPVSIFQVRAEGLGVEFPPLNTMDAVVGNLPAEVTSFLGRRKEVTAIGHALRTDRVVTLVGVGGVGKTRLALHTAAGVSRDFRDGTWLVELAPILDGSALVEAVAGVFAVAPKADRSWRDGLIEAIRARKLLLVLDNCEHVLDEATLLVEALVAHCPDVTVLSTSREALGVSGEWAWRVPSLDLGPDSTSVALFVDRARASAPEYDPTQDLDAVEEICRRLDGIPLAIELAAARVRSMTPTQIRDRLDERFRLLTGSRRSTERHQTLRHAVQWSYDLLNEEEQRVLRRVSVFAGGFALAAGTTVCGHDAEGGPDEFEMLDRVDSLVRKSLLQVERTATDLRYGMLETIRQFAEERLAESRESEVVRGWHAEYFADRAEAAFEQYRGPQEGQVYLFVDTEMANLRAAFRWAVDHGHADAAIRIAAGVHQAARMRLRTETFGWAAEVVDVARTMEHRRLPLLLTMACDSAWGLGQLDAAKAYGHEAVALVDDPRFESIVWAYADLAQIALFEGDIAAALQFLRTGAAHPADRRDRLVLAFLAFFGELLGAPLTDVEFAEALDQVMASGFPMVMAIALNGKAQRLGQEDPQVAIELLQQALEVVRSCGNRLMEQVGIPLLIGALAQGEDPALALDAFVEIVEAWRLSGDTVLLAGIAQLVVLLTRLGQHDGAARLYGAATRDIQLDALVPGLEVEIAGLRATMGAAEFESARAIGAALSYPAAADLAIALIRTARAGLAPKSAD